MKFRQLLTAFLVSLVFLLALIWATETGYLPRALAWLYLLLSGALLLMYAWDKTAAMRGWRRTPENTLHVYALLGGWPGALFAQQLLRHKSSKRSFRKLFWLTVALNLAALAYLMSPHGAPVARWLRGLPLQNITF